MRRHAPTHGAPARCPDARHDGHLDIEQHDLGLVQVDLRQGFRRIRGFADDPMGEVGRQVGQQFAQARTGNRLVVNDKD